MFLMLPKLLEPPSEPRDCQRFLVILDVFKVDFYSPSRAQRDSFEIFQKVASLKALRMWLFD